ncbi:MAG TPA: hypothetical protein VN247_06255 [Arenimonas sp.]|nr:hypothetical protein [Arenimonas sp.]
MTFTYEDIWQKITPELAQEIIAFWTEEKALPKDSKPEARAQQAVIAMRDEQGKIAAVSTAVIRVIPRLRQPMYYYRTFCAEKYRNNNTSIPMMKASQQALLDYNLKLEKPEAIGVLIEIENNFIATHYNEAFWPQTGFSFIGYSQRGLILRAYYFPGFVLMKPAPIQKQQKQSNIQIN